MKSFRYAIASLLVASCTAVAAPVSESHEVERLVPGSHFHGVHGLAFDSEDVLYAGSVVGGSIHRIDTATGAVETVVGPPEGEADDLVFLEDGTMVWTAIQQGVVYARTGDGPVRKLAEIPSVNSINVRRSDGRLFVGQVFGGDGVWEVDPAGVKPPRKVLDKPGGFNGFDIGPDGKLYGPLWFRKQVVRIDPDSGALHIVATGFHTPAAVNFDSKGNLYVLDTALGEVVRVDIRNGAKQVVAQLDTAIDNLAIDSRDRVFVSNMADNGIEEVDVTTGRSRQVVKGALANPADIAVSGGTVYVADVFALRSVDGRTGKVTDLARAHAADARIGYPIGVSAAADALVVLNSTGLVQRYAPSGGAPQAEWQLRNVVAALARPGGETLVLSAEGSLKGYTKQSEGRTIAKNVIASGGLALGHERANVAYALNAQSGELVQIDLDDGASSIALAGLSKLHSLCLSPDGAGLAIDADAAQLVRIDIESGQRSVVAENLPRAASIAAGDDGSIYMSTASDNSLWKLTPRRR